MDDFGPFMCGEKTLGQLREEPIDTHVLKRVRFHCGGGTVVLNNRPPGHLAAECSDAGSGLASHLAVRSVGVNGRWPVPGGAPSLAKGFCSWLLNDDGINWPKPLPATLPRPPDHPEDSQQYADHDAGPLTPQATASP